MDDGYRWGKRGRPDYRLGSAEQRHAQSPATFWIPERPERETLGPGDEVKLLFELIDPGPNDPPAERMWVMILARRPDGSYSGELDNVPYCLEGIDLGDTVVFGPEHIMDIERCQ